MQAEITGRWARILTTGLSVGAAITLSGLFSGCVNQHFQQDYQQYQDQQDQEAEQEQANYQLWRQQVQQDEQSEQSEYGQRNSEDPLDDGSGQSQPQ